MVSASQTDPARQVARRGRAAPMAGRGAQPQRPADLDGVAQRPQRLLAPGPGLIQNVINAAGRRRAGVPATGCQLPPVRGRPLPQVDALRQPVVIDKQPQPQWLTLARPRNTAVVALDLGLGRQRRRDSDPDIVLACAGDVVTMETVAAAQILREIACRSCAYAVVNVVDLLSLLAAGTILTVSTTPRSGSSSPTSTDVVFSFHGFPARSISSCTAGRRPTGSTCGASSSRARRRRLSTWWCATRSRASTW